MLKIDLKDAYYFAKILKEHRKHLNFFAGSQLSKFVVLPNRLSLGQRKFTAPYCCLKIGGNIKVIYIN